MKSVSNVRRSRAQLDQPEQRRLPAREFGPTANSQFKSILESPRNTEGRPAGRRVTHPSQSPLGEPKFNTVRIIMSNRLNPTKTGVNLHESRPQKSLGRSKKKEKAKAATGSRRQAKRECGGGQ